MIDGHKRKVILKPWHKTWWILTNEGGTELAPPVQYNHKLDAIQWAKAWVSSWTDVELVIEDGNNSEN